MTEACKMFVFPLARRVGKVRRVAEVYQRQQGKAQSSYWRTQTNGMWDQLEELGFTVDQITEQLDGFKTAVQCEINRRHFEGRDQGGNNPRGAA